MLKQLPLLIEDNLDGTYYVLFCLNGKIIKGNVFADLMPVDYESLDPVELSNYFQSWYDSINQSISEEIKEELIEKEKVNFILEKLPECKLLTEIDNKYYRLNNSVSLPFVLAQEYVNNQDNNEFISKLDSFWSWTALNMHEQKEMLYKWIVRNKFEITKDGFIVKYRNVIKLNNQFTKNVEQSYITIKQRKKSPKNYFVNINGELSKQGSNLQEVWLKNKTLYTHDRNTSESDRLIYELCKESNLDRSKVDFSNISCSKGIHAFGIKFMNEAGQNYCGNITVCVLANPMLVASCPDNYDKSRNVALYFCDTVSWKDGKVVPLSQEVIDKHSENYAKQFTQDLELFVNSKFDDINPKFLLFDKNIIREIINF